MTTHCAICDKECRTEHNFRQHLNSRSHQQKIRQRKADLHCSLCKMSFPTKQGLMDHRASEMHKTARKVRMMAKQTLKTLGSLYEKACKILEGMDDVDIRSPNAIARFLKKKKNFFACIHCFKEFETEAKLRTFLRKNKGHIYLRELLEAEYDTLLEMIEDGRRSTKEEKKAEVLMAKIVFALKTALLIHVFG